MFLKELLTERRSDPESLISERQNDKGLAWILEKELIDHVQAPK
jgi:hypothetical protein